MSLLGAVWKPKENANYKIALMFSDKLLVLDVKIPSICLTHPHNQALLQGVLTLFIGECQSEPKLWISVFTATNIPWLLVCVAKQPRHPCIFLIYLSVCLSKMHANIPKASQAS